MIINKEVIGPGTYYIPNKAGVVIPRRITPTDIKHFFDTGKQMLRAGLSVPVPLIHKGKPVTKEQRAANIVEHNKGWVHDWMIKDGKLIAALDIPDEEFAKQLPETVKFVSPEIDPEFVDGNGKKWVRAITHVNLSLRPVWLDQEPFKSNPDKTPELVDRMTKAALARVGEPVEYAKEPIAASLSSANRLIRSDTHGWAPADPSRFSLTLSPADDALQFELPDVVEKKKKSKKDDESGNGKGKPPGSKVNGNGKEKLEGLDEGEEGKEGKEGDEGDEGKEGEEGDDPLVKPDLAVDGEGEEQAADGTDLTSVMENLKVLKIDLPTDTNDKNFLERLGTALHVLIGAKPKAPEPTMPEAKEEQQGMLMSLDQQTPWVKALVQNQWEELKKRRGTRIDRLARTGRIPTQLAQDLSKECDALQMSLTAEGKFSETELDRRLSLIERVTPKGLLTDVSLDNNAVEQAHPNLTGGMTPERREAVVKEFTKNTGIQSGKA